MKPCNCESSLLYKRRLKRVLSAARKYKNLEHLEDFKSLFTDPRVNGETQIVLNEYFKNGKVKTLNYGKGK